MNRVRNFSIAACALALAACGSHGSGISPVPAANGAGQSASSKTASVTFKLVVPLTGRTAASLRPKYVSPNTSQFQIALTVANGQPVGNPQWVRFTIGDSSTNCSTSSSSLVCTMPFDAPVGNDVFAVNTLDGRQNSLSQATVPATIQPTSANVVPMTLNGVVAAVHVTVPTNGQQPGSAQQIPVSVQALDASGATIVGPGNYTNPITLTLTDSSNSTSLSETTVNSPSDTVTLNWNGSVHTQFAKIMPSDDNTSGASYSYNYTAGYFVPAPQGPYLWVLDTNDGGNNGNGYSYMIGFPLTWLRDGAPQTRPGPVMLVPGKQLSYLASDQAGNLYAAWLDSSSNRYQHVDIYAPASTTGVVSPVATFEDAAINNGGGIYALGAAPDGTVYSVSSFDTGSEHLRSYAPPGYAATDIYNNNAQSLSPLYSAWSVASDGTNLYSAASFSGNPYRDALATTWVGGASSSAHLSSVLVDGLAYDYAGHVAVATQTNGSNGLVKQVQFFTGPPGSSNGPSSVLDLSQYPVGNTQGGFTPWNGMVIDESGYIYTAVAGHILVFAPGSTGSPAPLTDYLCCGDPSNASGTLQLPSGVNEPPNQIEALAVAHASPGTVGTGAHARHR